MKQDRKAIPLNDKDRQEIKNRMIPKAACYSIAASIGFITAMGGALYPALRIKITRTIFFVNSLNELLLWLFSILTVTIIVGYLFYRMVNMNRISTLKVGKKKIKSVFLKNKMEQNSTYYFIVNRKRHEVDEITFRSMKKGDLIIMHYTDEDILGFHPIETPNY